jgi:hypothetical protein
MPEIPHSYVNAIVTESVRQTLKSWSLFGRKCDENPEDFFDNVDSLYDSFIDVFFTGDNLEHFLIHSCNASGADNADPITNTVVSIMSSPIFISLSNVGVRAFKNNSIATLPYVLLQQDQVEFVVKILASIRNGVVTNANSDANGGFVVRLQSPSKNRFVNKSLIMDHLRIAIGKSSGYGSKETKQTVFEIISQRVYAMTTLPKISGR